MKSVIREWMATLVVNGRPDEFETKLLLNKLGVAIPAGIRLAPGDTGMPAHADGPYVAKVCSPDIVHKTDEKGVLLHLDERGLQDAIRDLRQRFPGDFILVEQQVPITAQEVIVGGLVDPVYGPAVMAGAGGVLTEIHRDVSFRLAPFDEAEGFRMLQDLKIWPVFNGYRGMDLNPDGLAESLALVSRLVTALETAFYQLDINPMVCHGGRWTALDAKLMLAHSAPTDAD